VQLVFPLLPVDSLEGVRSRKMLTERPVLVEALLKNSRTVESWPSLSLASLVEAASLSLCSHLFVNSLSIKDKEEMSTLLSVVNNSTVTR
jgi:hypothetical protein